MTSLITTKTTVTRERTEYGVSVCTTEEHVPLTVPKNWSMYTPEGDRRITKMAVTCLRKVEKMVAEGRATERNVNRALVAFIGSWERMGMSGAGDTEVRACVGGFHDDIYSAVFGHCGCDVWENNLNESYRRQDARKSG